MDQSLGNALLAGMAGAAVVSLICAVAYPRLRLYLFNSINPGPRSVVYLVTLLLPLVTGIAFITVILSPALEHGPVTHHCHTLNVAGCVPHTLHTLGQTPSLLILLAASGLLLWPLLRLAGPLRRLDRVHKGLGLTADYDAGLDVHVIRDARPLAFCLGLVRPGIFISTGLLDCLEPEELKAVIYHERAHVRRWDTFWRIVGEVLSIGHFRRTAALLLSDLHLASEQASDDYASRQIGDRFTVAATIIKMERLCTANPLPVPAAAYSMMGSSVPARVRALISPPERHDAGITLAAVTTAICFISTVFLTAEPLHHLIESIL